MTHYNNTQWNETSNRIVQISRNPDGNVTEALFEAAEAADIEIRSQPSPLNDVVDGDALNKLFEGGAENDTKMFVFDWCETRFVVTERAVTVYSRTGT